MTTHVGNPWGGYPVTERGASLRLGATKDHSIEYMFATSQKLLRVAATWEYTVESVLLVPDTYSIPHGVLELLRRVRATRKTGERI